MNAIQVAIDRFLLGARLKTVTDLIFIPQENAVVVRRKKGRRGVVIDVSNAATPSEVIDIISHHATVY